MDASELQFRSSKPAAPPRSKENPILALAYVLFGALCLSNALWFYNWRVRAVEYHDALETAKRSRKIVTEQIYIPYQPPEKAGLDTTTADGECRAGILFRRSGQMIESTGERC